MKDLKHKIIITILKIPFVKKWYIGHELLKNPPTVRVKGDKMEGLSFTNVTANLEDGKILKDCDFKMTYKYFF